MGCANQLTCLCSFVQHAQTCNFASFELCFPLAVLSQTNRWSVDSLLSSRALLVEVEQERRQTKECGVDWTIEIAGHLLQLKASARSQGWPS